MDVDGVKSQFATALRQLELMHDLPQPRNDNVVQIYPSQESIVAKFAAIKTGSNWPNLSGPSATQLPPAYLPSDQPLDQLQPILIEQMSIGEHHRGKKATVRITTAPKRTGAVLVVAEDLANTSVILELYYQPSTEAVPLEELFHKGTVLIIKEPFFERSTDGLYSLRIDHLSDVTTLNALDTRIPDVWKTEDSQINSETVRMQGNEAVKDQLWAKALRLYTYAARLATTPKEEQLAYLNRSLANLKLNRPEQALLDAIRTAERIPPTEMALFREIRALYALRHFDRCLERLEKLTELYPANKDAKMQMSRVQQRLKEQTEGTYSFTSMHEQANRGVGLVDCATFSSPTEVRDSPGRGRGPFTVKAVKAGELLLCEKAFVYSKCAMDASGNLIMFEMRSNGTSSRGKDEILTQLVQSLYHNPEYSRPFLELEDAGYKTVSRDCADGHPIVDSFLVAKIMSLNTFGGQAVTVPWALDHLRSGIETPFLVGNSVNPGVWIKAARLNHACAGNCHRSFIGDMLILRACKDIDPGTELLFPYRQAWEMDSYEDVQRDLKPWGFTCDCALCAQRRVTSDRQIKERMAVMSELGNLPEFFRTANSLTMTRQLINQVKATYASSFPHELPRRELQLVCFSAALVGGQAHGRPTKEMLLEGLRALGYSIVVIWPERCRAVKARFEIARWGAPGFPVPWALVKLYGAAKETSPSLAKRILWYARTAYRILAGEEETFRQTYLKAR